MPTRRLAVKSGLALLWRDKWLLSMSLIILWCVRIALWVLGYNRMTRHFAIEPSLPPAPPALAFRVAASIRRASRLTPRPTCLVQAIAAQRLLAFRGHASQIHVGVRKDAHVFGAHAWIVSDGIVILGGDRQTLSAYRTLMEL